MLCQISCDERYICISFLLGKNAPNLIFILKKKHIRWSAFEFEYQQKAMIYCVVFFLFFFFESWTLILLILWNLMKWIILQIYKYIKAKYLHYLISWIRMICIHICCCCCCCSYSITVYFCINNPHSLGKTMTHTTSERKICLKYCT